MTLEASRLDWIFMLKWRDFGDTVVVWLEIYAISNQVLSPLVCLPPQIITFLPTVFSVFRKTEIL